MLLRTLVALVFATLSFASFAAAQAEPSPQARFERAVSHYENARYAEALADFERLHEISEEPGLLYNIARCQEQLGDLDGASASLERYLESAETGPDREDALTRLVSIERRRTQAAQENATSQENGTPPSEEPDAEPAQSSDEPADSPPPAAESVLVPAGAITLGAGGAVLLVGAILGGLTAAENGRLDEECPPCREEELGDLRALGVGADVAFIAGGVIAAAGLVMLILGLTEGDEASAWMHEGRLGGRF